MPLWSTPAYSPDRSLVWPDSFYYVRTDAGGVNLPGTVTTALTNTAAYHAGLPNGELFRFEPFATSDWDYSGTDFFNPPVTAGYFSDVWPGGAPTPTTWTLTFPGGSNGTSHLYFANLRQENSFKGFFSGAYTPQGNGGYDRHAILWAESVAYGRQMVEVYGYNGTSPTATSATTFDLTTYTLPLGAGSLPAGGVAARIPVAPFQFTYADLVAAGTGDLGHMIGWVAANYADAYQWPARADDGELAAGSYLKAGSVIRLKSTWTIPAGWPETLKALARTLQRYGAVLFDKNATIADPNPGKAVISSVSDPAWPTSGGANTLANLWTASGPDLSDFEEVDITPLKVADGSIEVTTSPTVGPAASFTATPTFGTAPLTVSFTDTSVAGSAPITGWAWSFGDTGTSTSQNPSHTYAAAGTYSVTLTVTDGNTLTDTSVPVTVTVTPEGDCNAQFEFLPEAGSAINLVVLSPSATMTLTTAGLSAGDPMFIWSRSRDNAAAGSGTITLNGPAGWTQVGATVHTVDSGNHDHALAVWWKPYVVGDTTAVISYSGGSAYAIAVQTNFVRTAGTSPAAITVAPVEEFAATSATFTASPFAITSGAHIINISTACANSTAPSASRPTVTNAQGFANIQGQANTQVQVFDKQVFPSAPTSVTMPSLAVPAPLTTAPWMATTFGINYCVEYECSLTSNSPVLASAEALDVTVTLLPATGIVTTYDVIWGDGNTETFIPPVGVYVFNPSHTYAVAGVYEVQVIVYNGEDVLTSCSLEVLVVGDVCESLEFIPAGSWPEPIPPGTCFGAIGFNVGGFDITWSATVDWGDGNTDLLNGVGGESVGIGHIYSLANTYLVTVTTVQNGVETVCEISVPVTCVELQPAPVTNCLPGATLGNGEDLRVFLVNRGATQVIAELLPVSGSFTRALDKTSTLECTGIVTGIGDDLCCDDWKEVYPWITEVYVWRDGRDAWSGPVTEVEFGYGEVTVRASDLTAWWDRRTVPDRYFVGQDIADIFTAVHDAAMAPAPVQNFTVVAEPTDIFADRSYQNANYQYASDALDELSKTGVDWTCYGRTVLAGGTEVPAEPYFVMYDDFWSTPPTVVARGNDQATRVIVKGEGLAGIAQAPASYLSSYGLLVRVFEQSKIRDQGSANAAARTRLEFLKDPYYIETPSGAALTPTAPVTLPELIPGIRVRVVTNSTCRSLTSDFRLTGVNVQFDGKVSIDLQPLGTFVDEVQPRYAKMIALGDSMTIWSQEAAIAAGKGEPFTNLPSARWQDLLVEDGLVGYSLNAAKPGVTTRSALNTPVVPFQSCDLLVIMLGANDMVHQDRTFPPGPFVPNPASWVLPAEYKANLLALLAAYPHDRAVIVLSWKWNVNLVDSAFDNDYSAAVRQGQYAAAAAAAAGEGGALFIDLAQTYNAPSRSGLDEGANLPGYLCDALIHPSEEGHRGIANLIEGALSVVP